ncbi:S1 family peptidase, partial [Streptomyces virginiae]
MKHTTPLRAAVAALLLTVGLGAAHADVASAVPLPQPAAASSAAAPSASAGLLDAMRRDLGLTASQAEERLSAEKA